MEKEKRRDRNGESNDSPEMPDRGETNIPGRSPLGGLAKEMPTSRSTLLNEKPISVITTSPSFYSEPVWPSGKALGRLVSGRTSVRYRFGSPFSSKRLWFLDTVLWLWPSLPTEISKWLSSLPILMHRSFWWWQYSDRYMISLSPHLHTPFPLFSPSLICRMVSVDVKHHVYPSSETVPTGKALLSEKPI